MYDDVPLNALTDLRLQLASEGFSLPSGFHAMKDAKPMRSRVFKLLATQQIFIHAVALLKSKLYADLRKDEVFVYQIACRMLIRNLLNTALADVDEHSIVFSTFSTGKASERLESYQSHMLFEFGSHHKPIKRAFWNAPSHNGLQIADYCSWLIQRTLENPEDQQSVEFMELMDARVSNLHKPFDPRQ